MAIADNFDLAADSKDVPNEIDYEDDDDVPATTSATATAKTASAISAPAANKTAAPPKPATDVKTASADAPATTDNGTDGDDKKTADTAAQSGSFAQGLAPTNAKTEAEKRAARAARFGITHAEDSEEAKKAARAERFGVANDAVAALDSALPDRPRKRGRGDEAQEDSRTNKRQSNAPAQTQGNQRNGGNRNNNQGGRSQGGRTNRQHRRGGAPKDAGNANGRQNEKAASAIDPAEKAKMEARARRFAA